MQDKIRLKAKVRSPVNRFKIENRPCFNNFFEYVLRL